MIFNSSSRRSGFILLEVCTAMGVFGIFAAALLTTWISLHGTAVNATIYARRQNDQMRVIDYLKRDIRRASSVKIYNGGVLVTGATFGSELRITVPDYYADAREEDDAPGPKVRNTPLLTAGEVSYGTALTVRYYVSNGAVIRQEAGLARAVSAPTAAFTLSFRKEANGDTRCRVLYEQPLQRGGRTLRRQIDAVCGQRSTLRPPRPLVV